MWRWVMHFLEAIAGINVLVVLIVGVGITYHRYKVKKRIGCHPPEVRRRLTGASACAHWAGAPVNSPGPKTNTPTHLAKTVGERPAPFRPGSA